MPAVTNRHDILIFFDVTNGNPNGDPDAGNLPRIEPNSGKGLVSDVCLKRKVRNFVAQLPPPATDGKQYGILVQQGTVLNAAITQGIRAANPELPEKLSPAQRSQAAEKAVEWLCKRYYDVRTFGGVLSTGEDVLKGSAYGQLRGPVQFTFGMSVDPIRTQEVTITRCTVTKEEDVGKERTMGNKHIVPYALYAARAFLSPLFAQRTGFDEGDLALFFEALLHLFRNDASSGRAEMTVRAIYDFEHVGTQPDGSPQNSREAMLGCAHAHRLFERVSFSRKDDPQGRTFPRAFEDYTFVDGWRGKEDARGHVVPGVKLNRILDPET